MPYNMLIIDQENANELFLDKVLGSGMFMEIYWEAVARKLKLPIISSMLSKADSECGFKIEGDTLSKFEKELKLLNSYWLKHSEDTESEYGVVAGKQFLEDLGEIRKAVSSAKMKKWL